MASISNPSLIHQSRFSSLYKHHMITSSVAPIYLRRNKYVVARADHLECSNKITLSGPVRFSDKSWRNPEILNLRGSSEFCITKAAAADADGHEIEVANGFEEKRAWIPTNLQL